MATNTIIVNNYVSNNIGVTPEEAKPVYEEIKKSFSNGDNVILDFSSLTMLTTAFLNVVIGNLYKDYSSETLRKSLKIEGVDEPTKLRIKKVIETAKNFYANQENFTKTVEEALHGNA